MKIFLMVAVTLVSLAQAQKDVKGRNKKGTGGKEGKAGKVGKGRSSEEFEDGEEKGMCADPEMLGAICVAGTRLGAKMNVAIAECYGTVEMETGRGRKVEDRERKPGKGGRGKGGLKGGKGGKCPSFDKLMEKIDAETADHRCVMEKMGWMDNDGNMVEDVYRADMLTLNKDLTDRIDVQEIEDCSNKVFKMMGKKVAKCASTYDDNQHETLEKIGMQMAQGKCASKVFMKACGEYVKESFMAFMMDVNNTNGIAGK